MRRQRKADELRSPVKKKACLDSDDDATPGGLPDAMDAVTCLFNANGGISASDCTLLRELFVQMYASDDLMKSKENRFQNRISLCL